MLSRPVARLLSLALLGYLTFVIYGSLVPLKFQAMPLSQAWETFQRTPYLQLGMGSRADWVANGLLFMPLSFLAMARLAGQRGAGARLAWGLGLWLACVLLALGIEFTQLFFPARTVSINDPLAEATGAALGLGAHAVWGQRFAVWLGGWWAREQAAHRAVRVLHLYLLGLLAYAMMPLDLTLSPVELLNKMKDGGGITLRPFADWPREAAPLAYKIATDVLLWVPVGLLWRLSGLPWGAVVRRGLVAAAVIEGLQLFVFSRHTSTSDVLTAAAGCAIGGVWAGAWARQRWGAADSGVGTAASSPAGGLGWGLVWWLAWAALALAVFWYPFNVDTSGVFVRQRLAELDRPLLATYYAGSEFHALTELLRKVLVFLPGGLLWAWAVHRSSPAARPWLRRLGWCWPPLLALLVEGGQVLMPGKVADLTDVLFETAGAWIGLALGLSLLASLGQTAPARPAGLPASATPGRGATAMASNSSSASASASASEPASTARSPAPGQPARRRRAPSTPYAQALPAWRQAAALPAWRTWAAAWPAEGLVLAGATLGLWLGARLPGVPYNLRELFDPDPTGLASAAAVVAVLWCLFALPLVLVERWAGRPDRALRLVPLLPLAVALPALGLVLGAPTESVSDVVGSPVLAWPAPLEPLLRFMALQAVLVLAGTGAAWAVARWALGCRFDLLPRWLMAGLLWAAPLHLVVVTWAATDNLTELMHDGGSAGASLLLFLGALALFGGASAWAAAAATGAAIGRLLIGGALAFAGSALALWAGSETALNKYGQVFSAAQFLLSADRSQYADPSQLLLRYGLACIGLTTLVALLQWPRWRRLRALSARPPS